MCYFCTFVCLSANNPPITKLFSPCLCLVSRNSYTFQRIQANTDMHWCFQRFHLVHEYMARPVLPPPLILASHIYLVVTKGVAWCRGIGNGENGLGSHSLSKACTYLKGKESYICEGDEKKDVSVTSISIFFFNYKVTFVSGNFVFEHSLEKHWTEDSSSPS